MDKATIDVYERSADRWVAQRSPRWLEQARALAARASVDAPVADLGCGPGWYAVELGDAVVALDAASSMLGLVAQHAPAAMRVRGDLASLPFRRGALGGAWARNSYVHVARVDVPLALADLHRSLRVDAPVNLTLFGGDAERDGAFADDDFPGRLFAVWSRERVEGVVTGAGFGIDDFVEHRSDKGEVMFEVRATRLRTLPDTVGAGMRLLVCGLNPSVYAADAGIGFARPGNRYWPAAIEAGIVTRARDPLDALRRHGVGMTDLVKRATVAASELVAAEYRDGFARVERLVEWLQPRAIVFVGLAGWRVAVDRGAVAGVQERTVAGTPVYLMPSTSGLNAHARLDELTEHLRAAAALADAQPAPPPPPPPVLA